MERPLTDTPPRGIEVGFNYDNDEDRTPHIMLDAPGIHNDTIVDRVVFATVDQPI